ncbi:hypothetical protein KSF_084120 [Reticulibacter mediterranei]|uniref:Uncharacterized protein n=1 Tax=Reticulibacter mediterranei TaxID=2778369 RepID=A0A8J3N4S8_9CHLR|nr:hypothetical protein [Reticulibacter mediterranei]GHO98364.1 hypothetical protein KSF_084120 [Reticulibacter mediterranei]
MKNVTQLLLLSDYPEEEEAMRRESIWLRYTGDYNEYYVTQDDYENALRPLVMKLRICGTCWQHYDTDANPPRPCVSRRICMQCMLAKHEGLRFLEAKSVNDDGEITYAFINEAGEVFTSRENYDGDISKDITYSLKQNGFTAPEQHKPLRADQEVRLHASHFTIYGDLNHSSVVVADYNDSWEKLHITFLLYKYAGYKELTKRGEGKILYEKAEAILQRTKRGSYYYIDGRQQSRIWDSDIYPLIAKMESAVYDLSLEFGPPLAIQEKVAPLPSEQSDEEVQSSPQVGEQKKKRGRPPALRIVQSEDTDVANLSDDEVAGDPPESIDETRVIGAIHLAEDTANGNPEGKETTGEQIETETSN